MFSAQESARQASAQAASDALDPFSFTVDVDCDEASEAEPVEPKDEPNTSIESESPNESRADVE